MNYLKMVGIVKFKRSRPKNCPTTDMIKNAKKVTTSPMIEAIIVFRAASTPPLSPPESIHLIPPQMRKNTAIRTAIASKRLKTFPIYFPKLAALILQSALNVPSGQTSTVVVCANATGAIMILRTAVLINPRTFFI